MDTDGIQLDPNMVRLVAVLNRFPGCSTFSCCGGHENAGPGQNEKNTFSVSIDFDRDWNGWRSLEWINYAVAESYQFDRLRLLVWLSGDEPDSMAFRLEGQDGADPDELAAVLEGTLSQLGL